MSAPPLPLTLILVNLMLVVAYCVFFQFILSLF